jgi:ParB family chromosome partitioning protein
MLESYGDIDSNVNFSTSAQIVQKLNSRDRMAQDFGLNRGMIARYVRINKLIDPLKKRLDNKKLGLIPAVELSYLTHDEQSDVDMVLDSSPQAKLDIKKAKIMRQFSEKKNLTAGKIDDILAGYVGKKRNRAIKPAAFKIKAKIMSKYFQNGYEVKEAEEIITQALDLYFSSRQ